MTIEFSASVGEKSRPIKKPIHAVCLTRQFNPETYDLTSIKCSSEFCDSCICQKIKYYFLFFFFSFFFISFFSKLYCHRCEKRKKQRKGKNNFCPTRTRTQDLSIQCLTLYLLNYSARRPGQFVFCVSHLVHLRWAVGSFD